MKFKLFCCLLIVSLTGCQKSVATQFVLEPAFPHLTFEQPLEFQYAPDGSGRLFVVEQKGIIRTFAGDPQTKESRVFLDWISHVRFGHSEEGMLGLAFHPRFKENGYFFIDYIADNPRRTVVSRFKINNSDPTRADPESEQIILEVGQPYGNHNGGKIAFGPDGYLYISLGDGGSAGDPHNHGQDLTTLLGSILRVDVDRPLEGKNYSVPPDNPFAGNKNNYAQEIYAYGLRNPWKFSFDPVTGRLWAGDVGQDKPYEEIDIIESGKNYGWNIMEGFHCFNPAANCPTQGLALPVWEYSVESGRSITGGYVYHGRALPALRGRYIYGDFMSGRLWALKYDGRRPVENTLILHEPNLYPSSFGVDESGELFICSFDGRIYRLRQR